MPIAAMEPLQLIFFGTAQLAVSSLSRLADHDGFNIRAVVTQPDRPKGRDLRLHPSPVKLEALRREFPVLQPERCRDGAFLRELETLTPDLIVVAAYGQILPQSLLDLPRYGSLNVHTSLLPKYRGAAPIQWAIWNGDPESGVTIMKMDAGMDTGDILTQESTPIHASDTAVSLHDRLAKIGADLLARTIPALVAGNIVPRKQIEAESSHARKITKDDGKMDWTKSATDLSRQARALTPWPGTFTHLKNQGDSKRIKIQQVEVVSDSSGPPGKLLRSEHGEIVVACGSEALRIISLQLEGRRAMSAQEFLAGHPMNEGAVFD